MSENRRGRERLLQRVECSLFGAVFGPGIHKVLLWLCVSEIRKRSRNPGIIEYKLAIKVRKAQKRLYIFDTA